MIKAMLKVLFFASYVFLLGFVIWEHSNVRNWRAVADNAEKARDKAAEVAKVALDRANRCFTDLAQQEKPPEGKPSEQDSEGAPSEAAAPAKPAKS
ncbi:MAG: hypothetical protein ACRD88_20695 [Terriglobia bacterium]